MPYFSNLQLLVTGLTLTYAGYSLAFESSTAIQRLEPLLRLVGHSDASPVPLQSSSEDTCLFRTWGVCLFAQGYFYLMSCYTNDEKFKRNSVPGRFILAFLCFYLASSKYTPQSSAIATSLLRLFGAFDLSTGLLMGLSIGFQDGNQVDIDEEGLRRQRTMVQQQKWKARETKLLDQIKELEEKLSAKGR